MSSNRRRGRAYRIVAITLAFLLFGVAIFVPLMTGSERNSVWVYIFFGVFLAAYVATVVVNEIIIWRRNKKANQDE